MGDFDRNDNTPKKSGKPQKVLAGVLTVALAGLVVYETRGKGPQTAEGSAPLPGDGADTAALVQTPEQVVAALKVDPTENLLTTVDPRDPLEKSRLRNPFRMSDSWRSQIATAPPAPVQTQTETPVAVRPEPSRVQADKYKLTMSVNGQYAAINNKIVTVGAVVDGARVIEIRADGVVLQAANSPDGPKTELQLVRSLNK